VNGVHALKPLYNTAYVQAPWTIPLFVFVLLSLAGLKIADLAERRRYLWAIGTGLALASLPLVSLPYFAKSALLQDPDRVGFPLSVGFVLLVTVLLLRFPLDDQPMAAVLISSGAVLALLLATTAQAYTSDRDYRLEDAVLTATQRFASAEGATSVVVRDYSGRLGDLYSLYDGDFQAALTARGSAIDSAVLCTPVDGGQSDVVARTLPLSVVPRCKAAKELPRTTLVLDVLPVGGWIAVSRASTDQ